MSLVNFTNLDFDQIKTSIRDYLRSNSNFTDYDFEGSNMSVIIDVLAYNTYISSYNANMVSNEVFLDSATLRENVVSLAKNIGYIPESKKSAKANISFFVELQDSNIKFVTLKSGVVCNTNNSNRRGYVFSILDDITVPVTNGVAFFDGIEIYEGTVVNDNFTVANTNSETNNQRFILENRGIDTDTLRVSVRDDITSQNSRKFVLSTNIFLTQSTSKVFYLQEVEDERYEILFGDDVFGAALEPNNYIQISYLISSGKEANSISTFNFAGTLIDGSGFPVRESISLITTNNPSFGGSEIESVNSIRKNAPRLYATQNRAVTAFDYESIIPKIYNNVEAISVFGGEELNPPQYGKVFITIKPFNGNYISNSQKDLIKQNLKRYSVAGIVPEILDVKYLYLELTSSIYFNDNLNPDFDALLSKVTQNIVNYAELPELNRYGARFKYSKYQRFIDDSDVAITSNITKVEMRRDLQVVENAFAQYEICFKNQFHIKDVSGYNIRSSGFKVSGISNTVYLGDSPNSDRKTGSLFLFYLRSENEPIVVKTSPIGSIDYEKGEIKINPINIISTEKNDEGTPIVEISVYPESNDVLATQDLYLLIDTGVLRLNLIRDTSDITTMISTSGENYVFSSSYSNNTLVRR